MHHRSDAVCLQQLLHQLFVAHVTPHEGEGSAGDFLHPLQGELAAVAEIIEYHYLVALLQ